MLLIKKYTKIYIKLGVLKFDTPYFLRYTQFHGTDLIFWSII